MDAVLRVFLAGQYLVNTDEDGLSLHTRIFTTSETILLILLSHGHSFKLGHSKWLLGSWSTARIKLQPLQVFTIIDIVHV